MRAIRIRKNRSKRKTNRKYKSIVHCVIKRNCERRELSGLRFYDVNTDILEATMNNICGWVGRRQQLGLGIVEWIKIVNHAKLRIRRRKGRKRETWISWTHKKCLIDYVEALVITEFPIKHWRAWKRLWFSSWKCCIFQDIFLTFTVVKLSETL